MFNSVSLLFHNECYFFFMICRCRFEKLNKLAWNLIWFRIVTDLSRLAISGFVRLQPSGRFSWRPQGPSPCGWLGVSDPRPSFQARRFLSSRKQLLQITPFSFLRRVDLNNQLEHDFLFVFFNFVTLVRLKLGVPLVRRGFSDPESDQSQGLKINGIGGGGDKQRRWTIAVCIEYDHV